MCCHVECMLQHLSESDLHASCDRKVSKHIVQANYVQHKMDPRAPPQPAPLPQSAGKFDGRKPSAEPGSSPLLFLPCTARNHNISATHTGSGPWTPQAITCTTSFLLRAMQA